MPLMTDEAVETEQLLSTCPLVLCRSPLLLRCRRVNTPLLVVMPLKSRHSDCTKMKTPVWSQAE